MSTVDSTIRAWASDLAEAHGESWLDLGPGARDRWYAVAAFVFRRIEDGEWATSNVESLDGETLVSAVRS